MINLITDLISFTQPTNLDKESLSVIESIAKIKTKINECINSFNNLETKTTEDYNNFLKQISIYQNEINNKFNELTKDNEDFKAEFKELINNIKVFNVTLDYIKEQSKFVQELAKYNQEQIDKGTIATVANINDINNRLNAVFVEDFTGTDEEKIISANTQAKTENKKVIFNLKEYTVQNELNIDGVEWDLRGGTINSKSGIIVKNNGSLLNGIINGCSVKSIEGKNRIENLTIKNTDTGLILSTGSYECFIKQIRLENETNNVNSVGILIECSDCTIDYIYGYGFTTGIKLIRGSDNYFNNVHLWLKKSNLYEGSKFINVVNATGNYFNNCVSDTYNYVFYFDANFLFVKLNQFYVIHNTTLYPNVTINLTNKNYNFLTGDCIVNSLNFDTKDITLNVYDTLLKMSYLNGGLTNSILNREQIQSYVSIGNVDNKSLVKYDGENLYNNISIFFDELYDMSTPYQIQLPLYKSSFKHYGYVLATNENRELIAVQCSLEGGVLTTYRFNDGEAPKVWSLIINFVSCKDVM